MVYDRVTIRWARGLRMENNKSWWVIRCVSQAEIAVFGGFAKMLKYRHTD